MEQCILFFIHIRNKRCMYDDEENKYIGFHNKK